METGGGGLHVTVQNGIIKETVRGFVNCLYCCSYFYKASLPVQTTARN